MSNAGVKVRRMKREEKLSVIWWLSEREEIRVLRGVVYMTKSKGPRTEP